MRFLRFVAVLLSAALSLAARADRPGPEGTWVGTIKSPFGDVRLVFKLTAGGDGRYSGRLDVIDQGAKDLPVAKVSYGEGRLLLEMPNLGASYAGSLAKDGNSIEGIWKQQGEHPLTLRRTERIAALKRPQTPAAPLPYAVEEVAIDGGAAGVRLAGTVTRPNGAGPYPAIVLISGSGPQDRDETVFGHKPFAVLADYLTRRGYVVLRYDDRGFGASTGDFGNSTTADFASDARAAVGYLKGRREVAPGRVGLIGHSEGGVIAPMVAADTPVRFIVLIGAPGLPGGEIVVSQAESLQRSMGGNPRQVELSRGLNQTLVDVIKRGGDAGWVKQAATDFLNGLEGDDDRKLVGEAVAAVIKDPSTLTGPWTRYFVKHDPRPVLAKVRCPVLALTGERDAHVEAGPNLKAMEQALRDGGNQHVTCKNLPGLNHLLQTCSTGSPAEYGDIEQTISPNALEAIGAWLESTDP